MEDYKWTIETYWKTQALATWYASWEDLETAHVHYKKRFLLHMRFSYAVPM